MISDDGIRQRNAAQTHDGDDKAPVSAAQFAKETVTYNNGAPLLTLVLLVLLVLVGLYFVELTGLFSTTATFHSPVRRPHPARARARPSVHASVCPPAHPFIHARACVCAGSCIDRVFLTVTRRLCLPLTRQDFACVHTCMFLQVMDQLSGLSLSPTEYTDAPLGSHACMRARARARACTRARAYADFDPPIE